MQAKVKGIDKRRIAGALMIVTNVDFVDTSGKVVHSQEYGHLPADVDPDYFQRQADTMQADIEQAAKAAADAAATAKEEAEADAAIARMKHKLQFNDEVHIHDVKS
jgi:hypothetical protein